ncbi:hypothetical protein [Planctobacterium marinum]
MKFEVKKIAGSAAHSAFTDLCLWNGNLYCCFREAENHISNDGRICILQLDLMGDTLNKTWVTEPRSDLRDPKLTVTPDNKLMLLVYQRKFQEESTTAYCKPAIYLSNSGISWSSQRKIGHNYWWLWRLRWHSIEHDTCLQPEHKAWGFAYNRAANRIQLYCGDPRSNFQVHKKEVLSLAKHNLGYPNESDIVFIDKTAYAIVRRDADSCTAQLGNSCWPFKTWQWTDLGTYIGGPCMILKDKKSAWVAGRIWEKQQFKTALFNLNFNQQKFALKAILPSSGDNSYPGLVQHANKLYLSYYSSHKDSKSQIFLAQFDINEL